MDDLVLRSRLEVLRRTLLDVTALKPQLAGARKELSELERALAPAGRVGRPEGALAPGASPAGGLGIRDDLGEVLERLEKAIRRVDESEESDDELLSILREARATADQAREKAKAAHLTVRGLQQRWAKVDEGGFGSTLDSYMINVATRCAREVDKLEAALRKATSEAELAAAWSRFETLLGGDTGSLLDEYVDFLAGLALRTVGFANDVCQRADALLQLLLQRSSGPKWDSLAVPAHAEALRMTQAQIIRLGFPGWTIWELPLAAHEFGHAVAQSVEPVKLAMSGAPWSAHDRRLLETLFADGFATYATGPAYACAALLLRLDPAARPGPGDGTVAVPTKRGGGKKTGEGSASAGAAMPSSGAAPSGRLRARMILHMLRQIDAGGAYLAIADELERQWSSAERQAGQPSAADPGLAGPWCEAVVELLRDQTPNAEYRADHWELVSPGVRQLFDARALDAELVGRLRDVRDVLNIAWQVRLQVLKGVLPSVPADGAQEPPSITAVAEQLWEAVTTTPGGRSAYQPASATTRSKDSP